jgi:hypothetical protein
VLTLPPPEICYVAAIDSNACLRLDAVLPGGDIDIPPLMIMNPSVAPHHYWTASIAPGVDCNIPILNGNGVPALYAIVGCIYCYIAAYYIEVVLALNAVVVAGVDCQRAFAANGKVIMAENSRIWLIRCRVFKDICISIGYIVLGAFLRMIIVLSALIT